MLDRHEEVVGLQEKVKALEEKVKLQNDRLHRHRRWIDLHEGGLEEHKGLIKEIVERNMEQEAQVRTMFVVLFLGLTALLDLLHGR